MMLRLVLLFTIIAQSATMQLFQNGILGELFKWDALMEHFQEHQQSQHHEQFLEFLFVHYCGHESQDNDHGDFPCAHFQPSNLVFVQQCCSIHLNWELIPEEWQEHPQPNHSLILDRYESNGIWHPPGA
jgi:hypothetical protein